MPNSIAPNVSERVIYSFASGSDGRNPSAQVIGVNGELYGTTGGGGAGCLNGCGTVFNLSASGQESVLYAFRGGSDGVTPSGPLTYVNGQLFGVTESGGSRCNCGTVFELSLSGTERVLYRFKGGRAPSFPVYGLTYGDGVFYGEAAGGKARRGVIYKMTRSGQLSVLYAFTGKADGSFPSGGLTFFNGNLYGSTTGQSSGRISLFKLSPSGREVTLHSFANYGSGNASELTFLNGALFGAIATGGRECASGIPCGKLVEYNLSGRGGDAYNFKGGRDGAIPNGLVSLYGNLYGTTVRGGTGCANVAPAGCGTVFELTPTGREAVLYRFDGSDGRFPLSPLSVVGGTVYGTTNEGGTYNYGTVFALTN